MKHVSQKTGKNEPDDFRAYRETTEGARYNGGNFSVPQLKERLLEEQGWICAYCMGKIATVEDAHVEHYCPQKACPDKDLDYMNLLAVCDGLTASYPGKEAFHHCDKTKGKEGKMNGDVKLSVLDPRSPDCETMLTYDLNGNILSVDEDQQVEHDLEKVLNLNNKALIQRRKSTLDRALELMKQEQPVGQWSKTFLEKHKEAWQHLHSRKERESYRPYCMMATWFIEKLLAKPKYQ